MPLKLSVNQLAEFHLAQKKCREQWDYLGMARILEDGTKEVGTLILPEVHEKVSANYTIAHGFKLIASADTWAEIYTKMGWHPWSRKAEDGF